MNRRSTKNATDSGTEAGPKMKKERPASLPVHVMMVSVLCRSL